MTSDLGSEDVVVRITTPQIISAETIATVPSAAAGRAAASSVAVEMGRRMLVAARAGDTQLVLDLMAQGAPFTTDWLGTSPLHLAANNGHVDTCAVLLRAGVSRDSRTKVERTPLHLAAYAGHAHVAALLLENGALVDCRDMLRMTPLHWAVARGHASVAAVLVRHGAEPRALSKFQKTPLSLATEVGRDDLQRLLEEAARAREAAVSVDALVGEQMTESATEPQLQTFDAVRRLHEILPNKVKQLPETNNNKSETTKTEGIEEGSNPSGEAAQLLRKHGITLLPHDTGSTVLNALQSGRTVVLSDAGKLLLKENSEPTPTANKLSTVASSTSANQPKGVVLTATPVKSPPKPGVKIFTLNNKLLAMPKESNKMPIKKVINPHDMQIKFVQLPPDAKIISPLKTKNRLTTFSQTHTQPHMITRPQAQCKPQLQAAVTPTTPQRPAVKIIMNKANFNKLMANANKSSSQNGMEVQASPAQASSSAASGVEMEAGSVVCVPEEFLRSTCPRYLRAQLLAAHRALADLNTELHACKARLASLERP